MNKVFLFNAVVLLFAFFSVGNLFAQNETKTENAKKNMINVYVAPGYHIIGGPPPGPSAFGYGLTYSRQLSERLWLYTGIEQTNISGHSNEGFITMPLQLKHYFRNWLYLNHGLLFDMNTYRYYKTSIVDGQLVVGNDEYDIKGRFGMGYGIGIGFEHGFKNGLSLSLNPFLGWHGLFVGNDYGYISIGIMLGVGYRF